MKRRRLIQSAFATSAVFSAASESDRETIIDSNISLFRYPFRRLPLDRTTRLVEKMKALGIDRGFAGSFEGIFHRDLSSVNRRLFEECRTHPEFIPIGSINPALPGWEEDFRQSVEEFDMPGVRLHPGYHGYELDDTRFEKLLHLASENNSLVQIVVTFEDVRTQPEQFRAPDVDLSHLAERAVGKIQLLNWRPRGPVLEKLAESPGIFLDTSRVDGTDGLTRLLTQIPPDRVAFGTHAPFLIPEAALIRIHENNLPETALKAVLHGTAASL